jgi:predicted small secreted protein
LYIAGVLTILDKIIIKDFGMSIKRRSSWEEKQETKLYQMLISGEHINTIYKTFPKKTQKRIRSKIHNMGFSTIAEKNLAKMR